MDHPPGGGGRRPAQTSDIDASSLELVLRALGAAAAAEEAAQQPRAVAAEQRAPVFNWNEEEDAAAKPAASHKDGERSPSRGPCKCGFKHWLKGIEYDWVIPIPTTVGMLMLGYNKSEDPYDAADRFIEEQKVKDSGLLDNSLVSNLVEYILACTEAGDEPAYPGVTPVPRLVAPAPPTQGASVTAKEPTKEELDAREQLRLHREKALRAEKEKAEAQKLEVKRRTNNLLDRAPSLTQSKEIALDKENRRREAEARKKEDEERRALAALTPSLSPTTSSSSLHGVSSSALLQSVPSSSSLQSVPTVAPPPHAQPATPAVPQLSSSFAPAPPRRPSRDPWAEDDEDSERDYLAELNRVGFQRSGGARHHPTLGDIDRYSRLRREDWTMEDCLWVYRNEGQMALLSRLQKAGFGPEEMIRLLQYASVMDQAERPIPGLGMPGLLPGLMPSTIKPVGVMPSRSPEPQVFRGQGHSLRSSEPTAPTVAPAAPLSPLGSSDPSGTGAASTTSGEPIKVDESQPRTSIKIRLHGGSQVVATFNHTHTILDIRRHIEIIHPLPAGAAYELLLPPPGRVVLADHSQTIATAKLLNATVIQSIR